MEPKLLLIKAITLLYKEALIRDTTSRSLDLAGQILAMIQLPATASEYSDVRDRLMALMKTLTWMIETTDNGPFDRAGLLQRIRVGAGDDDSVYAAFEIGIGEPGEIPDDIVKHCAGIRLELTEQLAQKRFADIAKEMYKKVAYGQISPGGQRDYLRTVVDDLIDLAKGNRKQIKGMVDEVYFENEETTIDIMNRAKDAMSTNGALIFGQQGMNEMTHDHPGALRGEYWLGSALSHHYKTGLGMNVYVDLPLLNKPWMIDPTKKPLIMHISTEDSAEKNVMTVYQMLMERETGVPCSTEGLDPVIAASYVKKRLSVNGYHTYMCRVDPSDTTVFDIKELIEQKEEEGYEIHAVIFDYPPMLDKAGLAQGPAGTELRDLHRRLRNMLSKRKIFCLAFHQLGPSAQQFERANVEDFVQVVAGKGHYDGSTKIFQELDVDLTIYIERIGDVSWLTIQCAKHRKLKRTPKHLWYYALKMSDVGGLRPDVIMNEAGEIVKLEPNFVRDLKPLRAGGSGGDWYAKAVSENMF